MRPRPVLTPSFRNRLRLFFVVIVIVPMIAVALVLYRLVAAADAGKVDASLSQAQATATRVAAEDQQHAGDVASSMVQDSRLADAIRAHRAPRIRARLSTLAHRSHAARAALDLRGMPRIAVGGGVAVAASRRPIEPQGGGRTIGTITVSTRSAQAYADELRTFNPIHVVIVQRGRVVASTLADPPALPVPVRGDLQVDGEDYRVNAFAARDFDRLPLAVHELMPAPRSGTGVLSSASLIVVAVLLGFLGLALAFALTVSRTLQAEIQRLLIAAQRFGRGDFSVAVPAEGNDEFAALGKEFNEMARQLEGRMEELQQERVRLQEAIRRVGESITRGLDRVGLLEIVVQTAVDGIGAAAGRASVRDTTDQRLVEVARAGQPATFARALHAAEAAVIDAGQVAEIQLGGASALAAPLGAAEEGGRVVGIVSVARADAPFSAGERELFNYLTNQAAVSVENVDLHETVTRQAVTDELTGLFNHRRFQEVMTAEVERARRYNHELGLIMLDIDNFKQINDTYGHLQGDVVLQEVARVLRQSSRDVDEPARYGGEEMAVALPQTDLEGAFQFAERVRRRIEALEIPLRDGSDGILRVTASFGAASLAGTGAANKDMLVGAADSALYEAKRTGKNRTARSPDPRAPASQAHGVVGGE
jgi:diguanylate cyclase (GGDEF)-like protein